MGRAAATATAKVTPLFRDAKEQWKAEGRQLGKRQRDAHSLMWNIGDWWNRGEKYKDRVDIVTADDWKGPTYGTCRKAGRVANRFGTVNRFDKLTFDHHRIVAPLPDEQAIPLLQWYAEPEEPRPPRELKTRVKQVKRDMREAELAQTIERIATEIGHQLYGVIYTDYPWRFEPYSRETGMDRAADNHYPTQPYAKLLEIEIPAAEDCALFMWATIPLLPEALALMQAKGFNYRSAYGWVKPGPGHGYWSQNRSARTPTCWHEGQYPRSGTGTQPPQVMTVPRGQHSEKPEAFAQMIERMFPNVPKLEMFARKRRVGWDTWGAEAEYPVSDR
jgi:N6-adenosine-specific RNA methylase IME4